MGQTATRKSLAVFWSEPAFAAWGIDFLWVDVAVAAMVRGDWSRFERRLTEGLAAVARAHADGLAVEDQAVEAAATAFRYDRDLVSGDEITAWLDRAGLSTADWLAFFTRDLLRRRFDRELDDTIDQHPPSTRHLLEAAHAEGVCSGVFDDLARTLAHRLALAASADQDLLSADGGPVLPDMERTAARMGHLHQHWIQGQADDEVRRRFALALRVEQAFQVAASGVTTEDELHSVLETRQIDWTHLSVESLSLATEHAAREALLCLTIDQLSLDDVGLLARQPVERSAGFLEDLPAEWRVALLSAEVGRPIGPLTTGDRFDVVIVTAHAAPDLDDPRVRARAERAAVAGAAERAAHVCVRWPEPV